MLGRNEVKKTRKREGKDNGKESGSIKGSDNTRGNGKGLMKNGPVPESEQDPLRTVLGKETTDTDPAGSNIHKDVASRWDNILKKGLDEPTKTELIKKYPTPKNCIAINPPQINPEVKAAVSESTLGRDVRLTKSQTQLGAALSALGKVLTHLLKGEKEGGGSEEVLYQIEAVSDAARLLADLHHSSSKSRQMLLGLKLDKSLKDIVNGTSLDGWLFGDNLSEKIRTAKAIEKSGAALKPTLNRASPKKPLNGKQPFRRNPRLSGYSQQQGHHHRQSRQQIESRYSRARPPLRSHQKTSSTENPNKERRSKRY